MKSQEPLTARTFKPSASADAFEKCADEIDRLTERLAGAYASVNLLTEMHEKAVAEGAELRRVTKALVKAFRAPYPFAEQGRAAQDAWAVAREDSLLNAVAVLGEQP